MKHETKSGVASANKSNDFGNKNSLNQPGHHLPRNVFVVLMWK